MHQNVENFYNQALKPHRYAYKVYSKVPISTGTIATLRDNMSEKLIAFRASLDVMNKAGLDFNPRATLNGLNRKIGRIGGNRSYSILRQILRASRFIFVHINRRVIQKSLNTDAGFLTAYETGANELFRANDSRSVRCYALWALKRRHLHKLPFEKKILGQKILEQWDVAASMGNVRQAIDDLNEGETSNAVEHIAKQSRDLNSYINAVFKVTGELGVQNWNQHNS